MAVEMRQGLEPELAVAIDPLVPTAAFVDSLHALRERFPYRPVSFSTEGLGGAERRCSSPTVASMRVRTRHRCRLRLGLPCRRMSISWSRRTKAGSAA